MELKEFNYLIALAQHGSISKAADQLFMAQSSLSQFLQQYEAELGVKLFVRTSKGIRPTHNGAVFIGHLQKLLADYQRAQNELWDNENLRGGKVTLGISSYRARWMLPRILKLFGERHPGVQVEVVEENSKKLEELLQDGTLDLAVIAMPAARPREQFTPLIRDEILIAANRDHPVMDYARCGVDSPHRWVELADAAHFGFILSDQSTRLGTIGRGLFEQQKLACCILHGNITADLAVHMASEGLGLAFTYASCVSPRENTALLRIGKEGVFLDLALAAPAGEYHSKAAQALESVIREVYQAG